MNENSRKDPGKILFLAISVVILVGIGWWIYKELTKPLPGNVVTQLGREHINDISAVQYNSNPPTSGPHFLSWAKPGMYGNLVSNGYLVHSLEHGYIIISYDCTKGLPEAKENTQDVSAGEEKQATISASSSGNLTAMTAGAAIEPETAPRDVPLLPNAFTSESCKKLTTSLSEYLSVAQRVIVVPYLGMDTQIALTAWGRIEKLNAVDDGAIRRFIEAYHNKGPEQTME